MEIMEMIRQLYSVEELQGYTEDEIAFVKDCFGALPGAVEESIECRIFGRNRKCSANRSGLETAAI